MFYSLLKLSQALKETIWNIAHQNNTDPRFKPFPYLSKFHSQRLRGICSLLRALPEKKLERRYDWTLYKSLVSTPISFAVTVRENSFKLTRSFIWFLKLKLLQFVQTPVQMVSIFDLKLLKISITAQEFKA